MVTVGSTTIMEVSLKVSFALYYITLAYIQYVINVTVIIDEYSGPVEQKHGMTW